MEGHPNKPTIFGWADTPWTVAALLGAWGVMIGIEEFFLADLFMVLAGVFSTARLARDCFQHRRRRWVPFVLWLIIIASIVGVDIRLTAKKRASSEAKAHEITDLTAEVGKLNGTVQKQSLALSEAQGHTDQHVSDIQDENKQLRASIDKKDAALVAIAREEYFSPQIVISPTKDNHIRILNTGKSAVVILRMMNEDGKEETYLHTPISIAKDSWQEFGFSVDRQAELVALAKYDNVTKDYRVVFEVSFLIETENHKRYNLPLTITPVVKDGAIASVLTVNHPPYEVKPQ